MPTRSVLCIECAYHTVCMLACVSACSVFAYSMPTCCVVTSLCLPTLYVHTCVPKESFYLSIIFIFLSFSHVVLVQLSPHCIQLKNKFVNKMYNMEIVETLYCINSDVMVL